MAKVVKFVKTLRNNWKKTTFAVLLGSYGVDYAYNRHKTFHMMKEYCEDAAAHGDKPLPSGAKNKHITLLLNPTAGNRKAAAKFEKYAEPILHLSGFLVNVVKTERISEARDLTELIEKTNVVAVAGGDGTLFEMITGLFRRDDVNEALRKYPVAIIPLGTQDEYAKRLFYKKDYSEAKFIAESAMAVVKHSMKPQDVIEIKVMEEQSDDVNIVSDVSNETGKEENEETAQKLIKPVYSMTGIKMGQFREAEQLKERMPRFLGKKFTTFWSLLRLPKTENIKAEIDYIPACSGCSKCKVEKPESKINGPSTLSRVLSIFRPVLAQEENSIAEENPDCGVWTSICVETPEFNIVSTGKGNLVMEIGKQFNWTEFIQEGLSRLKGEPRTLLNTIEFREAEIKSLSSPEFCSIDNEEFEVKNMKVKILPDKVYFFVP